VTLDFAVALFVLAAPDVDFGSSDRVPLSRAARPLILPKNRYRIDFGGSASRLDDDDGLFRLDVGGSAGLGAGLEARLDLLRWNFARVAGFGLEQPRLALAYGFLRGVVELAAEVGAEVPSGGDFAGDLTLLARLHGGPWVRLDIEAGVAGSTSPIRPESRAFARSRLVLTPIGPFSLVGGVATRLLTLTKARTLAGRAFAELSVAFPTSDREARAEVVLVGRSPEVPLEGADLEDPRFGSTFSGGLAVRLFFDGPASSVDRWDGGWDDDVFAAGAHGTLRPERAR